MQGRLKEQMKVSKQLKIVFSLISFSLFLWLFLANPFKQLPFHPGLKSLLRYTTILFLFAIPIEYLWVLKKRKLFDLIWWNDYLHVAKNIPIAIFISGTVFFIPSGSVPIYSETHAHIVNFFSGINFWLQVFLALFFADLYSYWLHRMSHSFNWLWYTHAVHHSITTVDWLAGFRNHVIDQIIIRLGHAMIFLVLGFDPKAIGFAMIFVPLNASLQHLNARIRIRFLEPWISTPFFHHWHHDIKIGNSKNFSNMFPIIDKMFGTYHLPDHWPEEVGIKDHPVSGYFIQQMIYPFIEWGRGLKRWMSGKA
jgi:sterol desaturase/sphingolipid hydroxylase (fatty acid hydroxylase superfamily)